MVTTFLLVEADEETRDLIEASLNSLGHFVAGVSTGRDAIVLITEIAFDAVITPLDDDFIETLETKYPHTKVILLWQEDEGQYELSRFSGVVRKPFTISSLRDAVVVL